MSIEQLKARLGEHHEAKCQIMLLVAETKGIHGDLPTMTIYWVGRNGEAAKFCITSKKEATDDK